MHGESQSPLQFSTTSMLTLLPTNCNRIKAQTSEKAVLKSRGAGLARLTSFCFVWLGGLSATLSGTPISAHAIKLFVAVLVFLPTSAVA